MSVAENRDFYERHVLKVKGKKQILVELTDPSNLPDLFKRLHDYSISTMNRQAAVASTDEENDPWHYYISPQYDATQLDLLEDVWRNDAVVGNGLNKYIFAIMSKHGRTVLDTALEWNTEEERRTELARITGVTSETGKDGTVSKKNTPNRYTQAKQQIDMLFASRDVNFHETYSDILEASMCYGRAAGYVLKDPMTKSMIAIQQLDSKRLGRVKVNKITKKIVAVEYYDTTVLPDGSFTIALESQTASNTKGKEQEIQPAFIPIEDLIYVVNKGSGIVKHSQYVGYSKLEPCIHLSQVKRIILNEMLKEAAKALYAGAGRVLFPPEVDQLTFDNFIDMMKRNVGRWFGHKIQGLEITVDQIKTEIEKYEPIVDLYNREILRCIGLASFLLGYEQIANYANSEQIMLSTKELDVHGVRTKVRDNIRFDVLEPLMAFFLMLGDITGKKLLSNRRIYELSQQQKRVPDEAQIQVVDVTEQEEYLARLEEDKKVKLTYEFEEINFSTRLESAQVASIIKGIIPYIPDEALLRLTGLEDWLEETLKAKEEYEKKQEEKMQMEFDQSMALMKNKVNFQNKESRNVSAAAASGDPEALELVKEFLKSKIEAFKRLK